MMRVFIFRRTFASSKGNKDISIGKKKVLVR